MNFDIELDQETDGRWIAEIPDIPGALAYGATPMQAGARVKALALRVLAERMERQSGSHATLQRPGWPDYVFAFHAGTEVGPRMLARVAKHTGLTPDDL